MNNTTHETTRANWSVTRWDDAKTLRTHSKNLVQQAQDLIGRGFLVPTYRDGKIVGHRVFRVDSVQHREIQGAELLDLVVEVGGYPWRYCTMPLANWLQHQINPHPFMDSRKDNVYPAARVRPEIKGVLINWTEGSCRGVSCSWAKWQINAQRDAMYLADNRYFTVYPITGLGIHFVAV